MLLGNNNLELQPLCAHLTSRSSHAERDGEKRSLTEPAIDDFARAKQPATIGLDIARAEWLRRAAARRRSLAPVR